MKNITSIHAVLGAVLLSSTLSACGDSGSGDTGSSSSNSATEPGSSTHNTTSGSTTNEPTTTTVTPTTTNDPTVVDPTTTTVDPSTTTSGTTDTSTSGTTGDGGFAFPDDPYDAYVQIDRHGAVEAGTAGIGAKEGLGFTPGQDTTLRNAYNASNPVEDAAGMWVPEIKKSVMFFHGALDDDLLKAKLVPATVDESLMQAAPVIVPDTIKYDPTKPSGYPNGRKLEDPVVDITLAVVLLKIGALQQPDILAKIPLNPPKNDVPFLAEFPYLAPPHPPKP